MNSELRTIFLNLNTAQDNDNTEGIDRAIARLGAYILTTAGQPISAHIDAGERIRHLENEVADLLKDRTMREATLEQLSSDSARWRAVAKDWKAKATQLQVDAAKPRESAEHVGNRLNQRIAELEYELGIQNQRITEWKELASKRLAHWTTQQAESRRLSALLNDLTGRDE